MQLDGLIGTIIANANHFLGCVYARDKDGTDSVSMLTTAHCFTLQCIHGSAEHHELVHRCFNDFFLHMIHYCSQPSSASTSQENSLPQGHLQQLLPSKLSQNLHLHFFLLYNSSCSTAQMSQRSHAQHAMVSRVCTLTGC